ncbi:unnamed protein product, partial [Urochloa humidicola]
MRGAAVVDLGVGRRGGWRGKRERGRRSTAGGETRRPRPARLWIAGRQGTEAGERRPPRRRRRIRLASLRRREVG